MLVLLPFISLGLLASAVPLKRQGVTCQTVHTGTLSLVSTDPDSTFAANVSIHLTSQASGFLAVGNAAQFIFEQCMHIRVASEKPSLTCAPRARSQATVPSWVINRSATQPPPSITAISLSAAIPTRALRRVDLPRPAPLTSSSTTSV